MNEKIDNIYIYIWEEFSTVYIGRTKNPKKRHYQHKTRECDKTYKFSSEHHVEHPPMIILESDLTIEEGAEREKYWINYYREQGCYNVINKLSGGQLGKQTTKGKYINEKKRQEEYYQKNREKKIAYQKRYRELHKKEIKLKTKKYYESHKVLKPRNLKSKEEIVKRQRNYAKAYRESHREEIKMKRKEYYKVNKEKEKAYRESHREEIRMKRKEYFKQYYQMHKEKYIKKN